MLGIDAFSIQMTLTDRVPYSQTVIVRSNNAHPDRAVATQPFLWEMTGAKKISIRNMPSVRNIDPHLLACLEVLVAEQHVTRAAERMNMTQSGMSNALARLRTLFGDPILVRTSHGMEPTARAITLARRISHALTSLDAIIASKSTFNPATDHASFELVASDYVASTLVTKVVSRLRDTAPHVAISIDQPNPGSVRRWLEEGIFDIAIGYWPTFDYGDLYGSTVFSDRLSCIVRSDHPTVGDELNIDDYLALRHAMFGSVNSTISSIDMKVDEALRGRGEKRNIGLNVPNFLVLPYIVANSDMIATIPTNFAKMSADQHAVRVLPLPFPVAEINVTMVWHGRTNADAAHMWFRDLVREAGRLL